MNKTIETSSSESNKTGPKGLSMLLCFAIQVILIELSRPSSSKAVLLPTRHERNFYHLGCSRSWPQVFNVKNCRTRGSGWLFKLPSTHTTPERFENTEKPSNRFSPRHAGKNVTIAGHLCLRKTGAGKSRDYTNVIIFEKLHIKKVFRPH